VFDQELVNSLSLTSVVQAPPLHKAFTSGNQLTKVLVSTYAGASFVKSTPVELEGWGDVAAQMQALQPGDPVTVNGHLAADGPRGGGAAPARGARLRVVVEKIWWIDPATVPPTATAAALNRQYTYSSGAGAGAVGRAAGGGSSSIGGGAMPMWRTPLISEIAAQFAAPGGSFLAMAAQYGVLPTTMLQKLLNAAAQGLPTDWGKLVHEVEQFASDGAVALSEVAGAVDAWVAANPGAVNADGGCRVFGRGSGVDWAMQQGWVDTHRLICQSQLSALLLAALRLSANHSHSTDHQTAALQALLRRL